MAPLLPHALAVKAFTGTANAVSETLNSIDHFRKDCIQDAFMTCPANTTTSRQDRKINENASSGFHQFDAHSSLQFMEYVVKWCV
jgi:hypothetical protein